MKDIESVETSVYIQRGHLKYVTTVVPTQKPHRTLIKNNSHHNAM
jgi:hypothetical protein